MNAPLPPFIRLRDLVNHPPRRGRPASKGLLPMAQSAWFRGIAKGRYPKPVKLGPGITAWRGSDIQALIDQFNRQADADNDGKDDDE